LLSIESHIQTSVKKEWVKQCVYTFALEADPTAIDGLAHTLSRAKRAVSLHCPQLLLLIIMTKFTFLISKKKCLFCACLFVSLHYF